MSLAVSVSKNTVEMIHLFFCLGVCYNGINPIEFE